LTYNEILQLYQQDILSAPLREKLNRLLNTPFVSNRASLAGVHPMKPTAPQMGKFLRVAQWNIERGLEFDAIKLAFTDPRQFADLMDQKRSKASPEERSRVLEQVNTLRDADLIVFNEVDWGVNRTLFRNVAAELADALRMNYAYGVEFVEVDPVTMGIDEQVVVREVKETYAESGQSKTEMIEYVKQVMKPDPWRYRGLHGTSILTRYPLENVRVVPFKFQGHDWYTDEKRKASELSKVEGKLSAEVFKEQLVRQVRRGGRMMLIADILDDELPSGRVTVVATHLEDMTTPANRKKQLLELLDEIKRIDHPVIVAGDMNTSTHDAAPLSVRRALKERFGSARWWTEVGVREAVVQATPFGWAYDVSRGVIGFARNVDDPTVRSIPLIGKNPEASFFTTIEKFRFADGSAFDFRGTRERSSNGHAGKLADSNERGDKGFVPTSELDRTYGPIGKYKLDWVFVRPVSLSDSHDTKQPYRFAPHLGRTLKELNQSIPERISDHCPITVDLPLGEPRVAMGPQ
jgi:endonuclease/exonuclease/phosphatase family metal-dependent hydrolase